MDLSHAHIILTTNAISAANPLANTTPTAIARGTVIQTNREEIKTTKTDSQSPPTTDMTTKKITTTTVEEVPISNEYVVKDADVYKPVAVISDTTPVNSANNQIVGTTASGSLTTPGKIVGDMEPIVAEHHKATVTEPVTKKVVTTENIETKK